MKKIGIILAAGVAALFIALNGMAGTEEYPLFVNGLPVSQEELDFHNGDAERTVRDKLIWNWAVEEGIADPFSYEEFTQVLAEENKKRKEVSENGGTVYGPICFTPMQYYKRCLGEYEQELKEKVKKEISQKEANDFYQNHKEAYRDADTIRAEYTVRQDGRIIWRGTVTLEPENMRALSEADEMLANHLLRLEEGGREIWMDDGGIEKELVCIKRERGGYIPYEEVEQAVLEQCAAERFEKELEERMEHCEIRG